MPELVELSTWPEMVLAAQVGIMRTIHNIFKGTHKPLHAQNGDRWGYDIEGAGAEMAVAKRYNLYWLAVSSRPRDLDGDVGKIQVRSTPRKDGGLILRPTVNHDAPYILARGIFPKWELAGWCFGHEGFRDEYIRGDEPGPSYWLVPALDLRDMDTFPAEDYGGTR
jgi:hypothetical protein